MAFLYHARLASGRRRIRDDRDACFVSRADRGQHGRAGVWKHYDRLDALSDKALDVRDRLLRIVLPVRVEDLLDVRALLRLILVFGAGDPPPRIAAEAVDEGDANGL